MISVVRVLRMTVTYVLTSMLMKALLAIGIRFFETLKPGATQT